MKLICIDKGSDRYLTTGKTYEEGFYFEVDEDNKLNRYIQVFGDDQAYLPPQTIYYLRRG